ncbi:MAG: type VI secretion system contractile sheath large subunit [Acidobacteriaceae bacterium]|nr:type VI secretion system contractile sheath large subunit [Acidobacteriaceae bacterium]
MATETKLASEPQTSEAVLENRSLLDVIAEEGRVGQTAEERVHGKAWLTDLVRDVMTGQMTVSKDTEAMINSRIADLDALISRQLNEVMHAEPFQKLEGSWRGLHYFVQQTETSTNLKIKLMNVSKNDLLKDFSKATEFDQSQLFKKIYEEEYGTLGGKPFGALVGDYELGRHPQDVEFLEKMAGVAATSHAPFLAAANSSVFNFQSFTELSGPRDLEKIFDSDAYMKWNMFRKSDDSRYVGLCMPHVLMRLPYGKDTVPVEEFDFEENVDGRDHSKYLWGNAAYAFASRLTDAFARHEWCAAIRGVEGGGLVEGLPAHTFTTDDGDIATKCPTEIAITDRRENELAKLGFIPLCYYKGTDTAVFMGAQSMQKPQLYLDEDANANSRLSTQLQYILACSRFAHFLKAMMRDKIGSFMSRDQCESFLNKWISHYVLLDDMASQDMKAKYPLREARIEVTEVAGKPGAYNAVAFLRPHFQLEALSVSLRLVAKLPAPKG